METTPVTASPPAPPLLEGAPSSGDYHGPEAQPGPPVRGGVRAHPQGHSEGFRRQAAGTETTWVSTDYASALLKI